jgi:acetylornithine deacetylase/succinyl-diaminopimelate desuccinylase-like protein
MPNTLDRDQLFAFAKSHRAEYEALLKRFVETPTVSCDPSHAEDIRAGLDLTVETLRSYGGKVEVYKVNKGNPLVHAVFGMSKNVPTVTVYNHIDVQPASKETEPWNTEPVVMTTKGDS